MPILSVRAKLLAFAAIVLAPLMAAAYLTAQNYISATREQILSSSAATAAVAVATVDDFLATAERILQIVSLSDSMQRGNMADTAGLFANILSQSPEYLSLYVLDPGGHLALKAPDMPATADDMRYGSEAMRSGQTSISGRLGSPDQLTAALAVPVRRGSQISGALGVEFALGNLERSVSDSVMQQHAVVLVFDGAGRVLVAPEPRYYSDAYNWSTVPIVQAALRGEQGAAEYVSPVDGSAWLGAYAPVRRANWAVLVSYPSNEVFAPQRSATLTAALLLGGVSVLAVVLAVILAARFTRPLDQVRSAALSIALGDYDRRAPAAAMPNDEIGQLAVAFNQMADALHRHMVALMNAQREIEQKALDLQQLLDRSVTLQEAERKRIAQEIHDGITQTLVGSIYEMQAARQALAANADSGVVTQKLSAALSLVSQTVSDIRRVLFDLHPTILDELGLVPALRRLAQTVENESLHCTLQVEGVPGRLSSAQELAVYRIAQEALSNVRWHANARQARLDLRFERDRTVLVVSDDGQGFVAEQTGRAGSNMAPSDADGGDAGSQPAIGAREHLGLISMKERAQSVGGQFQLASASEAGTSLVVVIPRMPASGGTP